MFQNIKLQYNRGRWYSPGAGRWLSEDPLGFGGGDTNLYRYVGNSHPNATDPAGASGVFDGALGFAVGFVGGVLDGEGLSGAIKRGVVTGVVWSQSPRSEVGGLALGVGKAAWGVVQTAWHLLPPGQIVDAFANRDAWFLVPGYYFVDQHRQLRQEYRRLGFTADDASLMATFQMLPVFNWSIKIEELRTGKSLVADTYGEDLTGEMLGERATQVALDLWMLRGGLRGLGRMNVRPRGAAALRAAQAAARPGVLARAASWAGVALTPTPAWLLRGAGALVRRVAPKWVEAVGQKAHAWHQGGSWAGAKLIQLADALGWKACFTGRMPILLAEGGESRPIAQIEEGDWILSRDEHDPFGPLVRKQVVAKFERMAPVLHVHLARLDGGGQKAVIETTGEHPFWVFGAWDFVPARQLRPGDLCLSERGECVRVEEVYDTGQWETVYNLHIEDFHTYFVGCHEWGFSVWAHNAECANPQAIAEVAGVKGTIKDWAARIMRNKGEAEAIEYLANARDLSGNLVGVEKASLAIEASKIPVALGDPTKLAQAVNIFGA